MPLGTSGQFKRYNAASNDYYMDTPGTSGGVLDMSTADGRYVRKDTPIQQTMAGALVLPADGLTVGTNQIKASGGRVGINRVPTSYALEVGGDVYATGIMRGDGSGLSSVSAASYKGEAGPSAVEFSYLGGLAGNIQGQLNGKLANAYASVSDGTTTAAAVGADTLRVRAGNNVSVAVGSNDPTYGDNILISASVPFAAPTASVGLSAVAGSASTAMRSDAAPALDQTISPLWTGTHTFQSAKIITPDVGANATQRHTMPAVASDILALLAASQALTNKTYNGLTITSSNGTLSVSNGKTLAVQNTITFNASADGFTATIPATGTSAMGAATLTVATINNVATANHTHAITSSSNPGAAASLLASDGNGYLQLTRLGLGLAPTHPLTVGGDVFINAATANLYLKDTSTGWQAASTGVITPQSGNSLRSTNFTSGLVGFDISALGNIEANNIDVRGSINAAIFTFNHVAATAGSRITSKAAAKLRTDVSIPAGMVYGTTTVAVEVEDQDGITHTSSQIFAVNDVLRLKDQVTGGGIADTWLKVSAVSDQVSFWRYTCIVMAGSSGASVTYRAGMAVIDYGVSGQGFILETADQTNAPYIQMATHDATFTAQSAAGTLNVTPQLRIGNLNGSYGYATDVYGFGAGQYGGTNTSWITVDQTNGLRIGKGSMQLAQWTIGGNILVGQQAAGQSNVFISNGVIQLRNNATAFIQLNTDGSGFVASDKFSWTAAGVANISGWTVNTASISSSSTYLASGFDIPSSGTVAWFGRGSAGYGGWLIRDASGRYMQALVNNGAIYPHLAVNDGTRFRVVIGGLNAEYGSDGLTDSMGMKIWDLLGNKLIEFSNVQNKISGWIVGASSFTSTGITLSSGASAYLAFGSTPPTSAFSGTGIFLDRTGLYGLNSSVVQVKFDATTGKITAGNAVFNSSGLEISGVNSLASAIKWLGAVDGWTYIQAYEAALGGGGYAQITSINSNVALANSNSSLSLETNSAGANEKSYILLQSGNGTRFASRINMGGSGLFEGVVIVGNNSVTAPLALLDVRGTTRVTGNVSLVGGYFATNVGIGVAPTYQLDIKGSSFGLMRMMDNTATIQTILGADNTVANGGSGRGFVGMLSNNALEFRTNNTGRVFITIDGSLGVGLDSTSQFGFGAGVLGLANALTVPTANPIGGHVLYSQSGALKGRGTSGTITTIAAAEPHCRRCGSDFVLEWSNPAYGGQLALCVKCLTGALARAGIKSDEYAIQLPA